MQRNHNHTAVLLLKSLYHAACIGFDHLSYEQKDIHAYSIPFAFFFIGKALQAVHRALIYFREHAGYTAVAEIQGLCIEGIALDRIQDHKKFVLLS